MCDAIVHRGPDDAGYYTDRSCGIGMRRLSIIDLHTGHQPLSNEDGSLWIVFNGEIYDYQNLRAWLIGRGHQFRTNSDTETIVHLYEEEGPAGFARLHGMFAFAIWDVKRQELVIARDRFGKKPLYYADLTEGFFFGSELKCLQAAGLSLDLDQEALRLYFQFGYVPDPYSPYRQVRKLAGGAWLRYKRGSPLQEQRYWRLPEPTVTSLTEAQARARIRETVDEAVRLRMIADVPLGAFLSGGIDSSIVTGSMARQSKDPVKTFSIGFEESAYNELGYAAQVAQMFKTEHHEILVKPDSVSLVDRLVRHFDEPFADSSAIPTYLVSEFAARSVKVALSGDGGDELFGGYTRFADIDHLTFADRIPQAARRMISRAAELLPHSAYGKNYLRMISRPSAFERYLERNFTPYFLRKQLLTPDWMLPADSAYLRRIFSDHLLPEEVSIVNRMMYFETGVHLTGDMLVKVDRMSMANSLEVRSPLLDQEVAAVAATIPSQWKIHQGRGKHILIEAFRDVLPPGLLTRPKQGFAIPLAEWLRGPLRPMLRDHVLGKSFVERGLISPSFAERLIDEHEAGRRDNSTSLWSLLVLELWFAQNGL